MRAHVAGMLPFGAKGEDESKENDNKHDWKHTEYRLQQIIDRPPRRVTLWSILGDSLYFLFLKFTFDHIISTTRGINNSSMGISRFIILIKFL